MKNAKQKEYPKYRFYITIFIYFRQGFIRRIID